MLAIKIVFICITNQKVVILSQDKFNFFSFDNLGNKFLCHKKEALLYKMKLIQIHDFK